LFAHVVYGEHIARWKMSKRAAAEEKPVDELESNSAGATSGETCEDKQQAQRAPAKRGRFNASSDPAPVSYRIDKGFRFVEPYDFDFKTHVKQRWLGREILEVFAKEFLAYSREYYRSAIEDGLVTVNGQRTTVDHILRDNELIVHRAVRCTENPVLDVGTIRVVADTEDLLVVVKPSSVPIHACGSYRYNTLVPLLREQGTVGEDAAVHTTHRLDRLTSGLVLLAKTKAAAHRISDWFSRNEIRKVYLARVSGKFRDLLDCPDSSLPPGVKRLDNGRVLVRGFMYCVDHKVGKYEFSAEMPDKSLAPKDTETEVELIGDAPSGESIVRCRPRTGRTHQIRVHLKQLRCPIANDDNYGGEKRNDPSLPLIPHVNQALKPPASRDLVAQDGADVSSSKESLHPSGIFLHAISYNLPDGTSFTCDAPSWATCCD